MDFLRLNHDAAMPRAVAKRLPNRTWHRRNARRACVRPPHEPRVFYPPCGSRYAPPTIQPTMPFSRCATLETPLRPYSRLVFRPPRNPRHVPPTVQPALSSSRRTALETPLRPYSLPCSLPAARSSAHSSDHTARLVFRPPHRIPCFLFPLQIALSPPPVPLGFFRPPMREPRHIFGLASPSLRTHLPRYPPSLSPRREHTCPSSPPLRHFLPVPPSPRHLFAFPASFANAHSNHPPAQPLSRTRMPVIPLPATVPFCSSASAMGNTAPPILPRQKTKPSFPYAPPTHSKALSSELLRIRCP